MNSGSSSSSSTSTQLESPSESRPRPLSERFRFLGLDPSLDPNTSLALPPSALRLAASLLRDLERLIICWPTSELRGCATLRARDSTGEAAPESSSSSESICIAWLTLRPDDPRRRRFGACRSPVMESLDLSGEAMRRGELTKCWLRVRARRFMADEKATALSPGRRCLRREAPAVEEARRASGAAKRVFDGKMSTEFIDFG